MNTPTYTEYVQIAKKYRKSERDRTAKALRAVHNALITPKSNPPMPFLSVLIPILGIFATWLMILIFFCVLIFSCRPAHAEAYTGLKLIEGYALNQWVESIHKAEGNDNYGIISISCESKEECRKICANTVRNNYKRWQRSGQTITFLQFLQRRFAPVGASNDPTGLNRNWASNVSYFLKRGA